MTLHLRYIITALLAILSIAPACNIINPDEVIPSYVYIDTFTFTCDASQGYPSEKITDGWVYANNEFIGVYELPATIPVLASGTTEMIVYPGIKENGISGTGIIYPFYTAYTQTITLDSAIADTLHPSCTYKPGALSFLFMNDFNAGNSFSGIENQAIWDVTYADQLVFEGTGSAYALMTGSNDTFRVASSNLILPTQDKQLFLEIDYKCDLSYQVWLNCNMGTGTKYAASVLTVTAKDYWNKIYINLNPMIQFFSEYQPETYNLEFRASKPTNVDTAYLFYDNIKIISSL